MTIDKSLEPTIEYGVFEIERHLHSYERWFEVAATASGEIHVADAIGTASGVAFQLDAGNDTWGSWVQILGSTDTPSITGSLYYDLHRIEIVTEERTALYYLQFGFGASGAAALTAGTYTETVYKGPAGAQAGGPVLLRNRRRPKETKAWARTMCPGQNTATIDFIFGIHEYER